MTNKYEGNYEKEFIAKNQKELDAIIKMIQSRGWYIDKIYADWCYIDFGTNEKPAIVTNVNDGTFIAINNSVVKFNCVSDTRAYDNSRVFVGGKTKCVGLNNSEIIASDNSKIYAYDNAKVIAHDFCFVRADGSSTVEAFDNVEVYAFRDSKVYAKNNANVSATDHSNIFAYDAAEIDAWLYATVSAFDNSCVDAYESSVAVAHDHAVIREAKRDADYED